MSFQEPTELLTLALLCHGFAQKNGTPYERRILAGIIDKLS